jgi:PIN domain nuclease of toxin-antitoxin system
VLLLDTHAFLWFVADSPQLSERAREAIATAGRVHLSAVSATELAIKVTAGKLRLRAPLASWLPRQMTANALRDLPLTQAHALAVPDLPPHHRDPWDRLLVAQAQVEGLTLVSRDDALRDYDVRVLW